jgi:hypothetical protein
MTPSAFVWESLFGAFIVIGGAFLFHFVRKDLSRRNLDVPYIREPLLTVWRLWVPMSFWWVYRAISRYVEEPAFASSDAELRAGIYLVSTVIFAGEIVAVNLAIRALRQARKERVGHEAG